MVEVSDIPQVSLDAPGPLQDQMAVALREALRLDELADATNGGAGAFGIDDLGTPAILRIKEVDVTRHGAAGDGVENDTAAFNLAKTKLRNAGGGILLAPAGTYLMDSFHWDWIAGGVGKFLLFGEGSRTILKKRVDDGATFFKVGRSDTSQTFQGGVSIENIGFDGVSGGSGGRVLDLWSLTTFHLSNVRARYGATAITLTNCVTGLLSNCQASGSIKGLHLTKNIFGDTTTSDPNLITVVSGAYKDNSGWGIHQEYGKQLVLNGSQIENNGTEADLNTGGLLIDTNAGYLDGVYRKGIAVNAQGVWFESNKGRSAVVIMGGHSLFDGCHWPNNNGAGSEIYNDGGKYTLVDPTMALGRDGGNIIDTANALPGNIIIGGEIATVLAGIDQTKTHIYGLKNGTTEAGTLLNLYKGRAPVLAPSSTDTQIVTGTHSGASGETVSFGVTFTSAPKVFLQPVANAPGRVYSAKLAAAPTTTGFVIEKSYDAGGSSAVTTDNTLTVHWLAVGPLA